MPKPLILIDGSSYLYRAFHAMPSLTNSKGFPTGAIYGVVNMLRKLLTDYDPEYIAVIFDAKGKTFRDDLYDRYKAHRPEMPHELGDQIEPIHHLIRALGIPLIMIPGVEADDIIGTLTQDAEKKNQHILISTGDKDLAQLVNSHVTLVNTMTETLLNPQTVVEKFGIPPSLIVDYLALIGDTVDNIPGVSKVGPKTAVKWLQQYGSLDNIIKHANDIPGKVGENLRASIPQIPLSKKLVTIKMDIPLNMQWSDLKRAPPDELTLCRLYQELEFRNWLGELLEKKTASTQENFSSYEVISSEAAFQTLLQQLIQSKQFVFDIKTSHADYMNTTITGIAFAMTEHKASYIPLDHDYPHAPVQLNREKVFKRLKPLFENDLIIKISHHLKYNLEMLANAGIHLKGVCFDTMLESYVLDSSRSTHQLDALALTYLGLRRISYEEIAGKGTKQLLFNQVAIDQAGRYAGETVDLTLQLHTQLWDKLNKETGQKTIFEKIEMPLIAVLARMELTGVLIDATILNQQTIELEKKLIELEKEITALAGNAFNINSPKQLQDILFNQLKLPVLQKTPTGQPSTADAVLQELALEFQLPKLIIEYRSLSKLITTYTKKLPELINSKTGRIHTSYNQTVTSTGRLSSQDPNLQNIPIRTQEGRRIRQAFIAAPGHKIIAADYSQIELRIMAHLSEDPNLLKAFANNIDIHTATAAEIMGISLDAVTYEERRRAKAVNFGLIYGMSAFGLAKQIGLTRDAAQIYIDRYFARYPRVKTYMEETRSLAKRKGYVETLFGRRLYIPDINSSQMMRQKAAERAAINAPLQGSAADIIKRAMIRLDHELQTPPLPAKMIMQVHDELVFEVSEEKVPEVIEIIRKEMMEAANLKVPLLVEIGMGDHWDAASQE